MPKFSVTVTLTHSNRNVTTSGTVTDEKFIDARDALAAFIDIHHLVKPDRNTVPEDGVISTVHAYRIGD